MKRLNRSATLAAPVLLAAVSACAPMEQAPLVYSSRAQIGVGITSGTTENPGLDVNIGFKALDAAFVPVAVAKHCGEGQDCDAIKYDIVPVEGQAELRGLSSNDERALADAEVTLAGKEKERDDTIARLGEARAALNALDRLPSMRTEYDQLAPKTANGVEQPLSAADKAKRDGLKVQIDRLAAIEPAKAEITQDIEELEALKKRNEDAVANAEQSRNQLRQRSKEETGDMKRDAFSVYGTFNGEATGNAQGASLVAGKVFSTGVAAQNLTQGVREASKANATTACLVAAGALLKDASLTDDQKKALPERLLKLCGIDTKP